MAKKLIIIGGGEHARVVIESAKLQKNSWDILGYIDPKEDNESTERFEISRLGDDSDLKRLKKDNPTCKFVCGLGDNYLRNKIIDSIDLPEDRWAIITHPAAEVSPSSIIGPGTVILSRAIVQTGAIIGKHCIINSGAILEHDSNIGDFTHIAPGTVSGGGVKTGSSCFVGLGSRIRDHISIGDNVTVGAGSVVVTDIDDDETVVGSPARRLGNNKQNVNFHELCIPPSSTIYEAMSVIGKLGSTLALVTDPEYNLLGLLSDGDIRRALLNNNDLNASVESVMNKDFKYVGPEVTRAAALDKIKALGYNHMPVVNREGKVAGVHLITEMIGQMKLSNIAVIMAGGKGTRLRPLTENIPKPMVKVAGRPILEHIILHLAGSNIRDIYISVNYLSEVIEGYFKDGSAFGVNIHYIHEEKPLGTGGALKFLPINPENPIIVMNGDLVTQFDVERMLHHHAQADYMLTIGAHDYCVNIPYGVINWDEDSNQVNNIEEKPDQHFLVNGGIYILEPEILDLIEPDRNVPMTELIDKSLKKGYRIGAHLVEGDWVDVGHHQQLAAARGL